MNKVIQTEEELQEAEKAQNEKILQSDEDLQTLLAMPEGRRFLKRLIFNTCHLFDGVGYCANGSQMYYNSGSRSVGLNIKEQIDRQHPLGFQAILKEEIKE